MIFCVLVVVLGVAGLGEARSISVLPPILLAAWASCTFYALLVAVRGFLRAGGSVRSMSFAAGETRRFQLALVPSRRAAMARLHRSADYRGT